MHALASIITVLAAPFLIIRAMLWLSSRQPRHQPRDDDPYGDRSSILWGDFPHVTGDTHA